MPTNQKWKVYCQIFSRLLAPNICLFCCIEKEHDLRTRYFFYCFLIHRISEMYQIGHLNTEPRIAIFSLAFLSLCLLIRFFSIFMQSCFCLILPEMQEVWLSTFLHDSSDTWFGYLFILFEVNAFPTVE